MQGEIKTRTETPEYRAGWERIWGQPRPFSLEDYQDGDYELTLDGHVYSVPK